jgi:hypothetical protein
MFSATHWLKRFAACQLSPAPRVISRAFSASSGSSDSISGAGSRYGFRRGSPAKLGGNGGAPPPS